MKALSNNKSIKEAGFSLVELLVALSLLAIVFTLSFPTLRVAIESLKTLEDTTNAAISSDYLLSHIQRIAQQSNPALGTELLGIAPNSILPTRLNATSEVLVLKDIALDTALAKNKLSSQTTFCALFDHEESKRNRIENSKLYLLQKSDGIALSSASIKRTSEKGCREYLLKPEHLSLDPQIAEFIHFSSSTAESQRSLVAIPILDLFAYYLDNQQTLRRYSFVNNQSQPLLRDVESFTLEQSLQTKGVLLTVKAKIHNKEHSRSFFVQHPEQLSYLNLLLL